MSKPAEAASAGPLSGLKVIELGQLLAGPFVGTRCAEFGAEVIKVEAPGTGDPMRNWGHHRFEGKGLWWPVLARNKKSVSANLRDPRGRELVLSLLRDADVLIENFKPGTLEKWDMSPEALHRINPRLIIVRVSGFGQTGPYADRPGFASVGEALSGLRYVNGYPDMPPPRYGVSLGDTLTALFAFEGLLMALYWRDASGGRGQIVDAAITESCFALLESTVPEYDKCGVVRQPSGTGLGNVAPSNIYPTKSGEYIVLAANVDPMFRRLCQAMGQPELAEDERFRTHLKRGDNCQLLDSLIADWTAQFSTADLAAILDEFGVVWGKINSIADVVADPHFQARGMVRQVQDDTFGEIAVPGVFPVLTATPGNLKWLGPQEVGAHNAEVYAAVGIDGPAQDALRAEGVI